MSRAVANQTRERAAARRLLLAADCVTAASVTMIAMDALRPGMTAVGLALIVMGAVVPRLAAEMVDSPRALFARGRQLTPARLLIAAGVLLALPFGYRALDLVPNLASTLGFEMILLGLCWLAGFGLRDPATWVVYEPLVLGTVLMSLARGASHPVPLVAAAFLAVCVSGALRRQLADSSDPERAGRVNVRSARLLGALAAVILVLVFVLSSKGLVPVLDGLAALAPRIGGREALGGPKDKADREDELSGGDGEYDPLEARVAGPGGTDGIAPPSLRAAAIPFGEGMNIGEVILRVTPMESGPEDADLDAAPDVHTLWRARTYVRFDPGKQEWVDDGRDQWSVPAAEGRVIRRAGARGEGAATWEATQVARRFDCLLLPYATHEVRLQTDGAVADLRGNARGDLTWMKPGLLPPTYWIGLQPLEDLLSLPPGVEAAGPSSPVELQTPGQRAVGVNLRALAHEAIGPEDGFLPAKVENLRSFFQKSFRYAVPEDTELPETIADFLQRNRVGTCQHFATAAALLLRASGVPTRLATGYSGTKWDAGAGEYVVRSGNAHGWIEVSTSAGWMPLDPTNWVRLLESKETTSGGRPPEDVEPPPKRVRPPSWLVFAIIVSALSLSLLAFFRKRRTEPRTERSEPEDLPQAAGAAGGRSAFVPRTPAERLLVDYGLLQHDLEATGQERMTHETPREHARRVSTPERVEVDAAFSSLVPMIDDGLYGHVDLTEDDLARGRRDLADIRKRLG